MKLWFPAAGLAAIVLSSAVASAHTPALVRPPGVAFGSTPGERLPGTDDINPIGEQAFSLSPDGKWLLYPSARGNIMAPAYVLYDIEKRQGSSIGLSPGVRALSAQGRGPLGRAGCWDSDARRVFLPGDRILFVADLRSEPLQWEVLDKVGIQEFRRYYDCRSASPDAASIVRTLTRSPQEVDIVSAANPGRVLASHKASESDVNRIGIRLLTVSPDRQRLSYVVAEYGGSFIIASRGYLLHLTSASAHKPRHLTDHILGPILWSSDNAFAYACINEPSGPKAIYRWRITDER